MSGGGALSRPRTGPELGGFLSSHGPGGGGDCRICTRRLISGPGRLQDHCLAVCALVEAGERAGRVTGDGVHGEIGAAARGELAPRSMSSAPRSA